MPAPTVVREATVAEGKRIKVELGDITNSDAEAIVNAANERLAHGGGVAGAISRKGGPMVQKESTDYVNEHGLVRTGTVADTGPGKLKCKRLIHAVGPIWESGRSDEPELLRSAVHNSLLRASQLKLKSISLPAISSGIFGFPKPLCAKIMFQVAQDYFAEAREDSLEEVRFTNFDDETVDIFKAEFDRCFGNRKAAAEATAEARKAAAEFEEEELERSKEKRPRSEANEEDPGEEKK
eukprot:tig00000128_g7206.t1